MSEQYDKLKTLLKELFQLDQPDLDFGLYRIMHARSTELTQFLDKDLLPQVKEAFSVYQSAGKAEMEHDLATAVAQAQALGADPETLPKIRELRARLSTEAVDVDALENEVYDHLYSFFRRYYSEGDFLAKRVYKPGVYAIPYEGEEVKLYWANRDQYYIKTTEQLRDYSFRLRPEDEGNPMRVHFRLVDAAEGEHGNVRAAEDKNRLFLLAPAGESGRDFVAEEGGELVISFEYRPATVDDWPQEDRVGKTKPPTQKDLIPLAAKRLLSVADVPLAEWVRDLSKPYVTSAGEQADYSRLEAHLRRYTARNTFDYFIHKDLGGFLRRELDFYIKNEVMHLDDIESGTAPRAEQYLSRIKVIRRIAGKIIDFLAQLEEFEKRLWLKKKFVVETQYCITLDRIPEQFYPEIAANDAQREEWVRLFAIDEIDGDLVSPAYSVPLKPQFLSLHPTLVLDTRHFASDFTARLVDAIAELDSQTSGLLLHSENFQVLNLIQARYRNKVRCTYLDPPYNIGDGDFLYKDNYQHSSWLAMMHALTSISLRLLSEDGNFYCSVDDTEAARLDLLLRDTFPESSFVAQIAYERSGSSGLGQGGPIVNTKEHIFAFSLNKAGLNDVMNERPIEFDTLRRYNKVLVDAGKRHQVTSFAAPSTGEDVKIYQHEDYRIGSISLRDFDERKDEILSEYKANFGKVFRLTSVQKENEFQHRILAECRDGLYSADYLVSRGRYARQKLTLYYYSGQIFVWLKDSARLDAGTIVKKNKITDHWSHGEIPKADLANEGGVTLSRGKKPEQLLRRLIEWGSNAGDIVLDYFSGSGTTAAVACKIGRRYIAADNEQYFDEKSLLRLKRVLNGETSGISKAVGWSGGGAFKYLRLESYEDALNNLETRRTDAQQSLLDAGEAQGADGLKEQYLLRYMLDVEARGSQSLLNVRAFQDPTAYKLIVKRPGSDERSEVNVDLLETFNWLLGLTVHHIAAPQTFLAEVERDGEGRLRLGSALKPDRDGPFWFRTVTGTTPDGRRTLVIWRKLTGDPERDNLALNEWFALQGQPAAGPPHQLVYVNGDNNLACLKAPEATWDVRLIEDDFQRLMFDAEGL